MSYIDGSVGANTNRTLKRFTLSVVVFIAVSALIFGFVQNSFINSSFELTSFTKITGTYHESPYPMLRIKVAENEFKNILLLGFGKSSANPYLEQLKSEVADLKGKTISIEGNLIYYNGKTLIQITDSEKVTLEGENINDLPRSEQLSTMTLEDEIIDPKCYFGVMKHGKGKIHRSCAVRCISGGIPPVLATSEDNNLSKYYLLTDLNGQPINNAILPFIGKPSKIKGEVEKNRRLVHHGD
ncbi:MAG: hypothetical protein ACI9P5_003878 [Saprospiraceae bacterium]|mgnify:CR=1 FL=1